MNLYTLAVNSAPSICIFIMNCHIIALNVEWDCTESALVFFQSNLLLPRVIYSIFPAAEGTSYPFWLINIPSDPLVYPSLPSGGRHGLVMIFPL